MHTAPKLPGDAPKGKHGPNWVSKTNIMRFRRCPYAFWLLDTGQVIQETILTEASQANIQRGVEFEASIIDKAKPLPEAMTIEKAFAGKHHLVGLPRFENPTLEIFGIPDCIETARGQLIPVEIKARDRSFQSDKIELAFYWMLLEPFRTKKSEVPIGKVILQTQNGTETVKVELRPGHFEGVHELIENVRIARRDGVKPTLCRCEVCWTRPEIQERARLMNIIGIGEKRGNALFEMGIVSLKGLLDSEPREVVQGLKMRGLGPSSVRTWQHHASALESGECVRFGFDHFVCPQEFIALDLEYVSGEDVWLFGVIVRSGGETKTIQLWADKKAERLKAVREIDAILKSLPDAQIITWGGNSADIPYLRALSKACGRDELETALQERHFDLYRFVERNFRFPTMALGLKSMAHHFGVTRSSPIGDGLQAQYMYFDYRGTKNPQDKQRLREDLLAYNSDDLTSLVEVIDRMSELCGRVVPVLPKYC